MLDNADYVNRERKRPDPDPLARLARTPRAPPETQTYDRGVGFLDRVETFTLAASRQAAHGSGRLQPSTVVTTGRAELATIARTSVIAAT
jgi:hypothetical protein